MEGGAPRSEVVSDEDAGETGIMFGAATAGDDVPATLSTPGSDLACRPGGVSATLCSDSDSQRGSPLTLRAAQSCDEEHV